MDQMFSNRRWTLINAQSRKHQCTKIYETMCPYQNIVLQALQTARFAHGSFALMITWQLGPGQNRSCGCDLTKSRNANCWYLSRVLGRLNRVNTKSSGARTSHCWAIHPMPSHIKFQMAYLSKFLSKQTLQIKLQGPKVAEISLKLKTKHKSKFQNAISSLGPKLRYEFASNSK